MKLDDLRIISEFRNLRYKRIFLAQTPKEDVIVEVAIIKDNSYKNELIEAIEKIKNLKIAPIIPILDYFEENKKFYIIKKLIPDLITIDSFVKQNEPDIDTIKRIGIALCSLVEFLYKKEIFHHNLTPYSIYIDDNGNLYLDDFGIIERRMAQLSGFKNNIEIIYQDKSFIAPEVLAGEEGDIRSEFFSIGMILAFLSTLKNPSKLRKKLPVNLGKYDIEDPNLIEFVRGVTAFNREHRFFSSSECRNILTDYKVALKLKLRRIRKARVRAIVITIFSIILLAGLFSLILVTSGHSPLAIFGKSNALIGVNREELIKQLEKQITLKLKEEEEKLKKYLVIKSMPEKAIVSINDEPVGLTPLTIGIKETNVRYKIKIEKVGFDPWERYIKLKPRKTNRIYVKLRKNLLITTVKVTEDEISSSTVSGDSTLFAVAAKDMTVGIFETQTWGRVTTLRNFPAPPFAVAFSPVKKFLAVGIANGELLIYDTANWIKINRFKAHDSPIYSLCFSPDGKYLISGGVDEVIKIWDPEEGELIESISEAHKDVIKDIEFDLSGKIFASASWDKTVKIWRTEIWEEIVELKNELNPVWGVAFNPVLPYLCVGCEKSSKIPQTLKVYRTGLWKKEDLKIDLLNYQDISGLKFSPDGKFLLVSAGNTIYVFSFPEWKLLTKLNEHTANITSLVFTPNGKFFISTDEEGNFIVWDAIGLNAFLQF